MRLARKLAVPLFAALLVAAPAAAQWQTIAPGGATACSDGSPYRFFIHPGDPAKLLVEFEGGGGCWSGSTCEADVYTKRITVDPELARQQGLLVGIYDRANPDNPVRDYTHVYVPYCTGDLHWGNKTQTYTGSIGGFSIEHKGAVNAASAVDWAFENVPAPSNVLVAGCSAGGYGAVLWSAHVMNRYPGASVAQLADSAAGVVPQGFFQTLLESWGVESVWPGFIPALSLDTLDRSRLTLADVYSGIAGHFPLFGFSQFNTLQDSTQIFFYALSQGGLVTADEWSGRMQQSVATIAAQNVNFAAYTAPGTQHCVINRPELYTTAVGGVRLTDWLRALLSTGRPGSVPN